MAAFLRKSFNSLLSSGTDYPPADSLVEDCLTCADPCSEHRQYPSTLSIDTVLPLLGSVKSYRRHILISTGQADWVKKIEKEEGTVAAALAAAESNNPTSWKNLITNTSMVSTYSNLEDGHDVIVLPDNIIVSDVTPKNAHRFYDLFVAQQQQQQTYGPVDDMCVHKNPYDSMLLICSHKRRDKRCGITAPLLAREFDHVLREKDIDDGEGGAAVLMVSHIGGHRFAGNVICYTHQGKRGIWYGRVNPCHCAPIVEETVLKGNVIKELYRGSMDHSFDKSVNKSSW
ncbi:hypothetical protein DFQ28_006819 [Apophysomyces sp. BC1034]|nr:hypothetical protein DFQ30_006622 [Apophysomyces sp. BC1015]KAG0176877.1 hypothetical protein DFQ29_005532 [Apophysomyces sp. BC1021]KAG0187138.1 hypothetical protein DFQ28_006819 [Apophysomyces sp. BC1034]